MGDCNSTSNCNPCGPDFNTFNQLAAKAAVFARQANTYATNAENAAADAEEAWSKFNSLYLGAFAVAPTVDNEGNPLQQGALYFNTVTNEMLVWNGLAWIDFDFDEFTPFQATGTTAQRNLVTRFADTINVKDYGAIGDGIANDTAAIQAALAAAGTTKTVLIPNGNYVVTANCVANAPVILEGFLTITSPTVKFELKSQPIVLTDYRKIYMGATWNDAGANAGLALQRAVEELLNSFRFFSLDGEGWMVRTTHQINCDPPPSGFYGQFKTIQNMQLRLVSGFGTRDAVSGVVTPDANAYAFKVNGGSAPASVYGINFQNVHIYCEKFGNGIEYNLGSNQESEINYCNITNFYRVAIRANNPLRINGCHISGGDFNLPDASRTITGIEILAGDSEILATTISYCKIGILVQGETLFISDSHIFNGSTDNDAPVIYVKDNTADLKINSCYLDNGPVVIERVSGYNNFGRVGITNSVFTWQSRSRGNRSFVIAKPLGTVPIRGIHVTGCQFRDYRIFQRERNYTGDGSEVTYDCPLVNPNASYTEACDTTNGNNQITVSSTRKYYPGLKVVGAGIPSNTVIDSIVDTQTLQLSNNATATATGVSLTFSETLEVRVAGVRVFNWTLSPIGSGQSPTQTLTFSSPPAAGASINLYAKYFAVVPFDVDNSAGSVDPNNAWDISIKDNSFYTRVTNTISDIEPVMKQGSTPIIPIETNNVSTTYPVDWGWTTPFRLHVLRIESIGWRCATTTYVTPPVIGYDYVNARRGILEVNPAEAGSVLIKANVNDDQEIIV